MFLMVEFYVNLRKNKRRNGVDRIGHIIIRNIGKDKRYM